MLILTHYLKHNKKEHFKNVKKINCKLSISLYLFYFIWLEFKIGSMESLSSSGGSETSEIEQPVPKWPGLSSVLQSYQNYLSGKSGMNSGWLRISYNDWWCPELKEIHVYALFLMSFEDFYNNSDKRVSFKVFLFRVMYLGFWID